MKSPPPLSTLLTALVLPLSRSTAPPQSPSSSPTRPPTAQFTVPSSADDGFPLIPWVADPRAVDPQTTCPGYRASEVQEDEHGLRAKLALAGPPCNVYGTDVEELELVVEYQSGVRLAVEVRPARMDASNASWYILPEHVVPKPGLESEDGSAQQSNDFEINWTNDPSFGFSVSRKSTNDVIFSSIGSKLVYEDQFIEFVTHMPKDYNIYGLGERIHQLRLGNNLTATIYAADAGTPLDYNIYGSHPVYLDTRYAEDEAGAPTSYSHGVYNRNAHAHEVLLRDERIVWRVLGGSIDLYFFDGPQPMDVIRHYQAAASGFPALQPAWAFGFQQCRWGYANWSELQGVVESFARHQIPLETVYLDIDYMNQYRDFEMDENTFPVAEGQAFLERLHENEQRWIPIVDSAIYIPNPENGSDAYPTYERGKEAGVFILNPDGSTFIGTVWPGYTVFPDWHAENSLSWWTNELATWHESIPFDGIWIDMSEVASFCIGSCGTGNLTLNPVHVPFKLPGEECNVDYTYPDGFNITNSTEAAAAYSASASQSASCSTSSSTSTTSTTSYYRTTPTPGVRNVDHPPYVINHVQGELAKHAVAPNGTHVDGVVEYDVHNLWGHQILNATYHAMLNVFPAKRPFILGRSTFVGSGKWAGHWGGDNKSRWQDMYFAIPQALSMSIFGISMFGPDVCGFAENTSEELCNRWMMLGAFFPFYRNHNVLASRPQEPYRWASVITASRKAMSIRYSLLPYLNTLFHHAHTTGTPVMRALAWEFPTDASLAGADRQFLLGPAFMVLPVLTYNVSSVDGVFPAPPGTKELEPNWYDWYTHEPVIAAPGENLTVPAPLGHIPLYVRVGHVLPMQEPGMTVAACRRGKWSLLVALDWEGAASGSLYLDDGEALEPMMGQAGWKIVRFEVGGGELKVTVEGGFVEKNPLANVTVIGLRDKLDGWAELGGKKLDRGVSWDKGKGKLSMAGLEDKTPSGAWDDGWVIRWG